MPYVSGLELAQYSIYEVANGAMTTGMIIEGPRHMAQLTFPMATMLRSSIRRLKLEYESQLIQDFNTELRSGNPVLAQIGRNTVRLEHRFEIKSVTRSATESEKNALLAMGPAAFTAYIHPAQVSFQKDGVPKQFLIELYGSNGLIANLSVRHLHDGIAVGTAVAIGVGVGLGLGIVIGWFFGRNQHEEAMAAEQHRHEEAISGLKNCTFIQTGGNTKITGEGHGSGAHGAGGQGEYSHSSTNQIHREQIAPVGSGPP